MLVQRAGLGNWQRELQGARLGLRWRPELRLDFHAAIAGDQIDEIRWEIGQWEKAIWEGEGVGCCAGLWAIDSARHLQGMHACIFAATARETRSAEGWKEKKELFLRRAYTGDSCEGEDGRTRGGKVSGKEMRPGEQMGKWLSRDSEQAVGEHIGHGREPTALDVLRIGTEGLSDRLYAGAAWMTESDAVVHGIRRCRDGDVPVFETRWSSNGELFWE